MKQYLILTLLSLLLLTACSTSHYSTPESALEYMESQSYQGNVTPYFDHTDFSPAFIERLQSEDVTLEEFKETLKSTIEDWLPLLNYSSVNVTSRTDIDKTHVMLEYTIYFGKNGFMADHSDSSYFVKKNSEWYLDVETEFANKEGSSDIIKIIKANRVLESK
jgi:hypothetical protein